MHRGRDEEVNAQGEIKNTIRRVKDLTRLVKFKKTVDNEETHLIMVPFEDSNGNCQNRRVVLNHLPVYFVEALACECNFAKEAPRNTCNIWGTS